MGQYGKQNPLFMYQGTEGITITAAAVCRASVAAGSVEPSPNGTAICSASMPPSPFQAAQGISLTAALSYGANTASAYTGTPQESGAVRCGPQ